jgi:hypothetical protein
MSCEYYRDKVEECRGKAAEAPDPIDKIAWLRLAETWQALTRLSEDVRSLTVMNPPH